MKRMWTSLAVVAMLAISNVAAADSITFNATGPGANGATLFASATFEVSGSSLIVTLANTAPPEHFAAVPADVLQAIYFDIAGTPALTPVSALLAPGSIAINASQPAGGNVGGEWAYAAGLVGAPHDAAYGISAAGHGFFGAANFNGPDLDPPVAVNGMNYGIVSGIASNANPQLSGNRANPLIQNAVVFTLDLGNQQLSARDISNVSFQYGTSLTDPNITPIVPEPMTLSLMALGIAGLALRKRWSA